MKVTLDPRALADVLRGPSGPVMRYTGEVATKVQEGAKAMVGVGADPSRGGRHLRDKIVKRFVSSSTGPAIAVGAEEPHALLHHTGTAPHVIEPKSAKVLRFPASKGSSVVIYAKRVQHPGTKPVKYLTEPARRLGLRVVEHG